MGAAPARRRRRKKIGAAGDMEGMLMTAVGLVAGSVAARELNTLIVTNFTSLPPIASGIGQMALGFILPMVAKNNKFITDMGYGMIANGGMVTIVSAGLISGETPRQMTYRINGQGNPLALNAVNGQSSNLPVVSGVRTRARSAQRRQLKNSY
jgi:hypothetical protein